jgi:hypothetical protein
MSLHPVQIEIFKKMPMEEKFLLMGKLFEDAKEIKKVSLKSLYPYWSEEQLDKAVFELFVYGKYATI